MAVVRAIEERYPRRVDLEMLWDEQEDNSWEQESSRSDEGEESDSHSFVSLGETFMAFSTTDTASETDWDGLYVEEQPLDEDKSLELAEVGNTDALPNPTGEGPGSTSSDSLEQNEDELKERCGDAPGEAIAVAGSTNSGDDVADHLPQRGAEHQGACASANTIGGPDESAAVLVLVSN